MAVVAAVVTVVYLLGLPCILALLPYHLKKHKKMRRLDTGVLIYAHERLLIFTRIMQCTSPSTVNPLLHEAPSEYSVEDQDHCGQRIYLEPQYELDDPTQIQTALTDPAVLKNVGTYIVPFKPIHCMWQSYDMLRKVMVTSFVIIVQMISHKWGLFYAIMAAMISIAIHARCSPYRAPVMNAYMTSALLLQGSSLIASLGAKYAHDSTGSLVVSTILILCHVVFLLQLIWYIVNLLYREEVMPFGPLKTWMVENTSDIWERLRSIKCHSRCKIPHGMIVR